MSAEDRPFKEFSSDLAGQEVGWVCAMELSEEESPYVELLASYTEVGGNGARYYYKTDKLLGASNGFVGSPISVEMIAGADQIHELWIPKAPNKELPGRPFIQRNEFLDSTSLQPRETSETGVWAVGGKEILAAVKSELDRKSMIWAYANAYHALALAAELDRVLPDPSMAGVTAEQVQKAWEVDKRLSDMISEDELMAQRLTALTDVPVTELPEVFVESRRKVALAEQKLAIVNQELTIKNIIPPVGFRPIGRSWPYMDSTESDESRAFGTELRKLESKTVDGINWVAREIDKELRELQKRRHYAEALLGRLTLLASLEQQEQAS